MRIANYAGSKPFREITLEDCMTYDYYWEWNIDVSDECTPILTVPSTILYITPVGRFGKLRFRAIDDCGDSSSIDYIDLDIEYVTFHTDLELYF